MKFLDSSHPMFRKPWVRVLTITAPALWGLVELNNGAVGWAILFFAAAAYAAYELLIRFDTREPDSPAGEDRSVPEDKEDRE